MENKFDHIEDSIRNSFEGFELPVSDTDWSRIASALDKTDGKKGFALWWENNKKKGLWGVGILALGVTGVLLTNRFGSESENNNKKIQSEALENNTRTMDRQVPNTSGGEVTEQPESVIGRESAGSQPGSEGSNGPVNPVTSGKKSGSPVGSSGAHKGNNSATDRVLTDAVETPEPIIEIPIAEDQPASGTLTAENGTSQLPAAAIDPIGPGPETSHLKPFGLRTFFMQLIFGKAAISSELKPLKLPKGIEQYPYYAALKTTYSPGVTTPQNGSPQWEGFQWINGSNAAVNIRLEAGKVFGNTDWQFTIGGAVEGNAMKTQGPDSIRIVRGKRFLPYYDTKLNKLYSLAVEWDTVYYRIENNPQHYWAEIPLGFRRSFELKEDLHLTAGISLNPGILIGSRGSMPNPYVYQSGTYWKAQYGINVDTSSAFLPVNQFMNPIRLGNGFELGIQKDMGGWNWAVQAQTRYYYTPVWRSGVPLKQNTIQYGINLQLGFKIK